jgi:hypothetical protein
VVTQQHCSRILTPLMHRRATPSCGDSNLAAGSHTRHRCLPLTEVVRQDRRFQLALPADRRTPPNVWSSDSAAICWSSASSLSLIVRLSLIIRLILIIISSTSHPQPHLSLAITHSRARFLRTSAQKFFETVQLASSRITRRGYVEASIFSVALRLSEGSAWLRALAVWTLLTLFAPAYTQCDRHLPQPAVP